MWVDTHCHPFSRPYNQDREAVIERARRVGVEKMIVVGFDSFTNRAALKLAEAHDFMWATLGVHPCECSELTDFELEFIRKEARSNKRVVALGEMGLDYHHMSFPKDVQEETFRKQVALAKELDLPCIVHSRDSAEDTLRILLEEKAEKVVFHCYTYDYEFGKKVWDAGFYTSFSGVVTYPQAKDIQEAAQKGPLDLFLVETDCPYLAPQSIRGKRNEMANVVEVGQKIAELRNVSPETISKETTANALRLFHRMD